MRATIHLIVRVARTLGALLLLTGGIMGLQGVGEHFAEAWGPAWSSPMRVLYILSLYAAFFMLAGFVQYIQLAVEPFRPRRKVAPNNAPTPTPVFAREHPEETP